jgi:excinuclease UvrABC nuclease subunit
VIEGFVDATSLIDACNDDLWFVYALFDGELLVYVGCTENIRLRLRAHLKRRGFDLTYYFDRVGFKASTDGVEALAEEKRLIRTLHPAYNVADRDPNSFIDIDINALVPPPKPAITLNGRREAGGRRF